LANVIVAFPKLEDAKNIRNLLVRNGYHVPGVCTSGAQALQFADRYENGIVICGYKLTDMLYTDLHKYLPKQFQLLLIASQHVLSCCRNNDVVCLELPIKVYDLVNTLEMMIAANARKRKKLRAKPKERGAEEKKIIEDAKKLLMERNNMSEEEAHRYLQKCSMDSGNSLVESAQMVFSLMKF